jgi:glucose-1-phosphate cytidylyltransferase
MIKEHLAKCFLHMTNVTIVMSQNRIKVHPRKSEPWSVTLVGTGEATINYGGLRSAVRGTASALACWVRLR